MKKYIIYTIAFITLTLVSACNIIEPVRVMDTTPPSPPTGVVVLNGDQIVDIYWNSNRENDLAGYNVYWSDSYNGKYSLLGSTQNTSFTDDGVVNGQRYYYAVTAYDYNGNESELSPDVAYATPRPEGFNQSIFDYNSNPNRAGYSFAEYTVVPYDDQASDFFFENYQGTFYLDVWQDTDIQDMGSTQDIYDIPFAPTNGWSTSKSVYAQVGHTYVIWTWNNHYAKVRISAITNDRIVFDWAYQLVRGEMQLKPVGNSGKRNKIDTNKLK